MVEVFKTNVTQADEAEKIVDELQTLFPQAKINFDLDDCDNILRIEINSKLSPNTVSQLLKHSGFVCEVLE
jgi:predicted RNA binding protein with dsRBD fold (UPF0201 family)